MTDRVTRFLLIGLAIVILLILVSHYHTKQNTKNYRKQVSSEHKETFAPAPQQQQPLVNIDNVKPASYDMDPVKPSESVTNDTYLPVDYKDSKKVEQCAPKDKLKVEDLLPKDAANSKWAQVSPAGQGDVSNQNFLTAGYLVGINTVGPTLRNANQQIRSDPPIERMNVGPWNQTTIEYDSSRKFFEIGEC